MSSKYDDDDSDEKEESKSEIRKGKESKGEDSMNPDELVEKVQEFFFTNETFATSFERFVEDRSHIVDLDSEEYKLEYTECYNDFKDLFEEKMEDFIVKKLGSSITEFYLALKTRTESDETSNAAIFGQILLGITDFDIFINMLRDAARSQRRK